MVLPYKHESSQLESIKQPVLTRFSLDWMDKNKKKRRIGIVCGVTNSTHLLVFGKYLDLSFINYSGT